APRRPVGQAAGRAGRRGEDGGVAPEAVRDARGGARRGSVQCRRGGSSPLPPNRYGRRLRPSSLPRRSITNLGGGVGSGAFLGREPAGRQARCTRLMDLVADPALADLHPTGHHPDARSRYAALLDHFGPGRGAEHASVDDVELCHDAAYVGRVAAVREPTWLDGDTIATSPSSPPAPS